VPKSARVCPREQHGRIIVWDNRFLSDTSGRNWGVRGGSMMYRITPRGDFPRYAQARWQASSLGRHTNEWRFQ